MQDTLESLRQEWRQLKARGDAEGMAMVEQRAAALKTPELVPCDRMGCVKGEYYWGAIENGIPTHSGPCWRCGGTQLMPARRK